MTTTRTGRHHRRLLTASITAASCSVPSKRLLGLRSPVFWGGGSNASVSSSSFPSPAFRGGKGDGVFSKRADLRRPHGHADVRAFGDLARCAPPPPPGKVQRSGAFAHAFTRDRADHLLLGGGRMRRPRHIITRHVVDARGAARGSGSARAARLSPVAKRGIIHLVSSAMDDRSHGSNSIEKEEETTSMVSFSPRGEASLGTLRPRRRAAPPARSPRHPGGGRRGRGMTARDRVGEPVRRSVEWVSSSSSSKESRRSPASSGSALVRVRTAVWFSSSPRARRAIVEVQRSILAAEARSRRRRTSRSCPLPEASRASAVSRLQ